MQENAKKLHTQAEEAREKGDFLKALELTDQATVAYQKAGDISGFAEVQSSRFLTLRHLYEQTDEKNYLILAKHAAMASVEIAQSSGKKEALAIPWLNLGKSHQTLGEFEAAVSAYKKALAALPDASSHNRPAVAADIKIRLAVCEYKTGDKSALERAESALKELSTSDEMKYNKEVWLSGAHMKIADMLHRDNPEKAKEHLEKVKEIIDANPDLKIRKRQFEKLQETI